MRIGRKRDEWEGGSNRGCKRNPNAYLALEALQQRCYLLAQILGREGGSGRAIGEKKKKKKKDDPFQYSYLRNPVDREAWWVTVNQVAKESDTT